MDIERVTRRMRDYDKVIELIDSSFPKEEQLPMFLLRIMSKRRCVDFLAYYDEGVFCGISYSIISRGHVFVLYVAVSDGLQSKGYGSFILDHLKELYNGAPLTLNVEPLDPESDNNHQRIRRMAFYTRNGFRDTGHTLVDGDIVYTILSTAEEFVPSEYGRVLRSLTLGTYMPKIV